MKRLLLLVNFLILIQCNAVQAQSSSQDYISVDSLTFWMVAEWTGSQDQARTTSLEQFLSGKIGAARSKAFLQEFRSRAVSRNAQTQHKTQDDCACALLVLNSNQLNYPSPTTYSDNDDDSGVLWSWDRDRSTQVHGAAHKESLAILGNKSGNEYSSADNSNWSRSRISFNWVCLNTDDEYIPSDCDCDKELRVEAQYDSKINVSATADGIGSKAAFTKGEDGVVIFAYDHPNTINNNPNVEVLGAKIGRVATYVRKTWNPDAVIDIVKLAGTVTAAIVTSGWSETVIATTIPDQIGDIISHPLIFNQGTTNSSSYTYDKTLSLNVHDQLLMLQPNIPKSLVIAPTWNVYGRGYGANWTTEVNINSNFAMGMLLKMDNSDPYCCVKQVGMYNYGTYSGAPANTGTLANSLSSFFNLYGFWQGGVSSSYSSLTLNGTVDCPPLPPPCEPSVSFTLNDQAVDQVSATISEAYILDFSNTLSCTGDYFISILSSDANWNGIGEENGQWLSAAAVNQFGGINAFNLKQFNSTFNTFDFEDGQYYRVKAAGEPWTERVILLLVSNPIDDTRQGN